MTIQETAAKVLAAAKAAGTEVYDKTVCPLTDCCADIDGVIRAAAAAALQELSQCAGHTGPLGPYRLLRAATMVELMREAS